ncbi:MAG TPA: ferritin-like domain-containing protein [Kofleriaceae bacterium]|nr:ferritin-like domain-containing protein [Kofleriaceae bacterium]
MSRGDTPASSSPPPSSAGPSGTATFARQDWDNGHWGIQTWLERTAWKTLKNTSYGRPIDDDAPHPALFEDPLLQQVYLTDLALFVGAERTSYHAVAGMMRCAPDELAEMQLGTQVLDECRHYEVFCKRMADMGVTPEKRNKLIDRYTTPALRSFYDLILEQVDKKDFYAASIAQNLIMEGMAYPVYRYEIRYWSKIDPGLTRTIQGAFADEAHHVGFGEAVNRAYAERMGSDERNRIRSLARQFGSLMRQTFEEVINRYIGLYQECANQYMDVMGDIEIFRGRKMADTSEEDQVRIVLKEIEDEHQSRLERIGLA